MKLNKKLATTALAGVMALGFALTPSPANASSAFIYEHKNLTGVAHVFNPFDSTFGATCTTDRTDFEAGSRRLDTFKVGADTKKNWNDRISSVDAFGLCLIKIFEHENFGGAAFGFTTGSAYVGDIMNDEASSVFIS